MDIFVKESDVCHIFAPKLVCPHFSMSELHSKFHARLVVASITEIKTGYRGFETKRNPVFRTLALKNYSRVYMSDNL